MATTLSSDPAFIAQVAADCLAPRTPGQRKRIEAMLANLRELQTTIPIWLDSFPGEPIDSEIHELEQGIDSIIRFITGGDRELAADLGLTLSPPSPAEVLATDLL